MINFSPDHCRAAREKLRWSQGMLAKRSGISQPTIAQFEGEKIGNPSSATLLALQTAFEREGITFVANGVSWGSGASYSIEGTDWWLQVLDDVYVNLMDRPEAELILLGADDRKSPPAVNNRYRKMRNAGIRMRQFVCEGNTYLMGPLNEYRFLPAARFMNYVTLLYGDRIGVSAEGETKALIIKDEKLAGSWRNYVELLWDILPAPERSTANERF